MPRHVSRDSRDSLRNALVLETDAIDRLLKTSRERMLSSERLIDIGKVLIARTARITGALILPP